MARIIRSLLIASSLLWLSACTLLPAAGPEPVTIRCVVIPSPWQGDPRADYEQLAAAYHAAHPHITIEIRTIGLEELQHGLAQADFLSDSEWGIDVVVTGDEQLPELAPSGLFRDLTPSLEADPALQSDDLLAPALERLRQQGHLYALPLEIDPWVMAYNRDLFDAAGVPYPAGGWSWVDFLATARALANSPAVRIPFGSWGAEITPFVYQNGGALLDDTTAPGRVTLDDAAAVEAIRWYVNLALAEGVMPTPAELAEYAVANGRGQTILAAGSDAEKAALQARADLEQAIVAGDVAIWMAPFFGLGGDRGGRWAFAWSMVPLPTGRRAATVASLQVAAITAHSEQYAEALGWIDFLSQQQPIYRGLPARRSVAASRAFQSALVPQVSSADACLAALETTLIVPAWQHEVFTQRLQEPLLAVLAGSQSVEEALAAAQQDTE